MAIPVASEYFSIIPDLPRTPRVISIEPDSLGELDPVWALFFDQLITSLENTLSTEGFSLPALNTEQILSLTGPQFPSNLIYDRLASVFRCCQLNSVTKTNAWTQLSSMVTGTGAPGNTTAGIVGQLYMNTTGTTGSILYICTKTGDASGTATAATWVLI